MEIKLSEISVDFSRSGAQKEEALKQVSLRLRAGEAVALLGPIGAGKSTLLRVIAGLIKPVSGSLTINPKEETVGLSIQEPQRGFFAATVREEVAFGPENQELSSAEVDARVAWALGAVNLPTAKWEVSPLCLSGGEQRRVALAATLAMKPRFLLLDEPTIGLDGPGYEGLIAVLEKLRAETKIGLLVASHDPEFLYALTERVLVLAGGKLYADTTWGGLAEQEESLAGLDLQLPFLLSLLRRLQVAGAPVDPIQERRAGAWAELKRLREAGGKGAAGDE
jgi:energy-coupling factor transport system ATP-binding protein